MKNIYSTQQKYRQAKGSKTKIKGISQNQLQKSKRQQRKKYSYTNILKKSEIEQKNKCMIAIIFQMKPQYDIKNKNKKRNYHIIDYNTLNQTNKKRQGMTSVRIQFKSFHKTGFNQPNYSQNKLSQSFLVSDVRSKILPQRQRKPLRTVSILQRENVRPLSSVSTRGISTKKTNNHEVIYNYQIRKLQKLDNKIQQQLNVRSQRQIQQATKKIEQEIGKQLTFQIDRYIFLNRYCRNFQLMDQKNKHSDISLVKLTKKR